MITRYLSAFRSRPLAFAVFISSTKTFAADLIVQTTIEDRTLVHDPEKPQKRTIDWRRSAFFAAFGACYLGGVQYAIYTKLMPWLFRSNIKATCIWGRVSSVTGQVFFDQFLHVPLLFFPCFYVMKECVESDCLPWVNDTAQRGMHKYAENAVEDITTQLSVFFPGAVINFAVMPIWLRTPWVATVSFVYTLILSTSRGDEQETIAESQITLHDGMMVGLRRQPQLDLQIQ